MKQTFLLVLLSVVTFLAYAQEQPRFSLEAGYPVGIGNNFVKETHNGILDLGFKFRFIEKETFRAGISLSSSLFISNLEYQATFESLEPTSYLYTIQPRAFGEVNFATAPRLHPAFGIGYMRLQNDVNLNGTSTENVSPSDLEFTLNGLNINLAFAYDISNSFFVQLQYDFMRLRSSERVDAVKPPRIELNFLKFGIGVRF